MQESRSYPWEVCALNKSDWKNNLFLESMEGVIRMMYVLRNENVPRDILISKLSEFLNFHVAWRGVHHSEWRQSDIFSFSMCHLCETKGPVKDKWVKILDGVGSGGVAGDD